MIIRLSNNPSSESEHALGEWLSSRGIEARRVEWQSRILFVTSADIELQASEMPNVVEDVFPSETEYQLCARTFSPQNTQISLADDVTFGSQQTVMIAGPCAVESEEQTLATAAYLRTEHDVRVFRAGAFKPRTSPYSFQGLGEAGLRILEKVRADFGMLIISEVKDVTHFDAVADVADIVQIGAKSMYNSALLERCGRLSKPVLLKRGFMTTLKEFLQAADVILASGNPEVILCERGIRTFEPQTRFSLDVCGAALLKRLSHLPIVLDPSHAIGIASEVPAVAQAAAALGVDGIMVEVHPDPPMAKSDRAQALSFEAFSTMTRRLQGICAAVGRELVA